MPSSALAILHAFHRQLQQSIQGSIKHFHGQSNPAIATYAARFQNSLPKDARPCSVSKLVEEIQNADTVLFGDFHTLPESQSGFFDILKKAHESKNQKTVAVALEIFSANDQSHIDEYLSGRLPEEYFLKRIDYHNKWGFPWENYRPIVDYCARNKIAIYGINHQTESKDRLNKRDIFAADVINRIHQEKPNATVFCLIGEYHLADCHLPAKLNETRIVRVINNADDFSHHTLTLPLKSFEVLEMGAHFYCVLNTAPWLKWQSLSVWEELHGASEDSFYGGENDVYTEDSYDLEYQLLFILKSMNDFLGLNIPSAEFSFDIYLKPDRSTLSYVRSKFNMSRQALEAIERKLNQDGFCYIPKSKVVLLLDFSMSHLIEAAGHILLECMSPRTTKNQSFGDNVHYQVAGSLCGLVMNPRRRMYSIEKVREHWQSLERKRLLGEAKRVREALKLVSALWENDFSQVRKSSKTIDAKDKECHYLVSRIIGETIAIRLFESLLYLSAPEMKKGLKALFENDLQFYLEELESSKIPLPAAS